VVEITFHTEVGRVIKVNVDNSPLVSCATQGLDNAMHSLAESNSGKSLCAGRGRLNTLNSTVQRVGKKA